MQERRQPEIIAGRVNSDGSIAAGDGFTVQKGAAGLYTITLGPGFRALSFSGTAVSVAGFSTGGTVPTERSFTVFTSNAATGAATDSAFLFTAVGIQT